MFGGWQGCQLECGAGLPHCNSYVNVGQTVPSYIYTEDGWMTGWLNSFSMYSVPQSKRELKKL